MPLKNGIDPAMYTVMKNFRHMTCLASLFIFVASFFVAHANNRRLAKTRILRGQYIKLQEKPQARQRLLRYAKGIFSRIYDGAEDRVAGSPSFLKQTWSPDLKKRWDTLKESTIKAIETAPIVIMRRDYKSTTEKGAFNKTNKKRKVVFEFYASDSKTKLGELKIERNRERGFKDEVGFDIQLKGRPLHSTKTQTLKGFFASHKTFTGDGTISNCDIPYGFSSLFDSNTGWSDKALGKNITSHSPSPNTAVQTPKRQLAPWQKPKVLKDYIYANSPLLRGEQKATSKISRKNLHWIPNNIPALPWVSRMYNKENSLASVKIFAHQHVVGNTGTLLLESGVKPQNVHLWGKPYSIMGPVASELQQLGYHFHGGNVQKDAPLIMQLIETELKKIKNPQLIKKPKFLVLDDGGEMITEVTKVVKRYPNHAHLFAGVEQTTKGRRKVEAMNVPFPVVNVAGDLVKTRVASLTHGYAISKEVNRLVNDYRNVTHDTTLRSAVVFGYGNIGSAVAAQLKKKVANVTIYDPDPMRQMAAQIAGYHVAKSKREALPRAQILVSCVGKTTLETKDLVHLPIRSVVANGGSANEFTLHQASPMRPGKIGNDAAFYTHQDTGSVNNELAVYTINKRGFATQQVYVAKAGGVINFPRGKGSFSGSAIPDRYIQVDLGLMYLGLLQAKKGGAPGLQTLNKSRQAALMKYVEKDLAKSGESAERPRWQKKDIHTR